MATVMGARAVELQWRRADLWSRGRLHRSRGDGGGAAVTRIEESVERASTMKVEAVIYGLRRGCSGTAAEEQGERRRDLC